MRKLVTVTDGDTGIVVCEKHYLDGKLHRNAKTGPAYIERWPTNGLIVLEIYYWHGLKHRVDGPAAISRTPREILCERDQKFVAGNYVEDHVYYYRHGREHRDPKEGPSRLARVPWGIVVEECFCWNGEAYRDPADGPWHVGRRGDGTISFQSWSEPQERPKSYVRHLVSSKLPKHQL